MMLKSFITQNFGKLFKNVKEYKTKLLHYQCFCHQNRQLMTLITDRVSEPLKFRRDLYFRQVVRSANCPFGKMSVRQNIRSPKRPFGKMSVRQNVRRQNVFRQNVFRQSVFRQNVRPPRGQ